MKKWFLLLAVLMLCLCVSTALADGSCGENVTWTLSEDGVLTISGTGDMESYRYSSDIPWKDNRSAITSIVVQDGVTSLSPYAFYSCNKATTITLPDSITTIGKYTFAYCSKLTAVNMPNQLMVIPEYCFTSCYNLTELALPLTSVTTIEKYAFSNCSALTSFTLPASVTSLNTDHAFSSCNKIAAFEVAPGNKNYCSVDGVLYTADQTTLLYYPAGSMTTAFTVPNTVTTINAHAFDNAKYLKSVTLPESVRTIENEAFYNCTKLESIALNEGLTTIGDNVFYYNGLTSVRLPASLTTIGKSIFYYCRYLTAIEVAEDSNKFTSVDGVLYSKDKTQLIAFPANYAQMDYTIPEGVTGIEAYAFYGCGITSVTFPSSLRTIGSYAFSGCEELTKVELPEGFQVVGEDAFYSCDALTTVIIPASCTEVKSYAFYSNKSMTSVTIKGMDTNLDSWSPFEYANENLVFYAQAGSTAEALCAKKEYTFVPTTFDAPVVETPQPIIVTPEPVIVMPTPVIVTPTPAPQAEEEGWDCPNCNAHWVNAKFCGDCGTRRPIAQNCPGCGYVLPTDKIMNFCPECGFKLIAN